MGSFDEGENPDGLQLFSFRKDEAIYREGDAVVRWYLIASGAARTCRTHGDGHRQLIGFHYPGDFFGIEQGVHIERAEALSELRCWGFAQACGGVMSPRLNPLP